ncbi:interferon-induced protein 44-like [Clarias gariepinus]|uniref:interferon-induced protein 44-like n=1 Tax=Clarias gariepinus TaxID=13013 RepID=UPI00234D5935|nr:interferon-induced protein 44-like [Clarias gariepinus]XP_053332627.1 interferon-induced protein 44-like [Clarias gariepinus]
MVSRFLSWSGLGKSRPSPPPKELDKEWRVVNWGGKDEIEAGLREIQVNHPDITHLRILVYGAVGAGKSSFINSADSAFEHRVKTKAGAASKSTKSHTTKYKSYKITSTLPFIFNDVMGLQDEGKNGIHSDDIINAMLGHVRENYEFNPVSPIKEDNPKYNSSPTLNDKAHCVVSVLSAQTLPVIYEAAFEKIKHVWKMASDLDIPHVLLLTHIDECCPLVKENLRNVYISRKIREKMVECSHKTGIPMTCIFPVKNYHEETDTDNDIDILVLLALRQIFNFANDYVKDL